MEDRQVLSVGQLNRYVKSLLEGDPQLFSVWVSGEISNFTNHKSGHLYFSLKDENALVKAVMFRGQASGLPFLPENGMKVIVRARASLYDRDGSFQLYVEEMQPDGIGALQLAYEQLKARLEEEGLFDPRRKRPLPRYPRLIGVITSPTGAAVRDILNILSRRYPAACVVFCPVLVQGEGAPPQLAEAVERFDRLKKAHSRYTPDVLIIGRGGGSIEELWAFNDERVARAVAGCSIPVISAVGHETDFTICDFAADLRAPTPSAAAELAVPDTAELLLRIEKAALSLRRSLQNELTQAQLRLKTVSSRRCLQSPYSLIEDRTQRLDYLSRSFASAAEKVLANADKRLSGAAGKLDMLSPLRVLARGYAIVNRGEELITGVSEVKKGDTLSVRMQDGYIECTAERTGSLDGTADF